jgi:hypothetical protein
VPCQGFEAESAHPLRTLIMQEEAASIRLEEPPASQHPKIAAVPKQSRAAHRSVTPRPSPASSMTVVSQQQSPQVIKDQLHAGSLWLTRLWHALGMDRWQMALHLRMPSGQWRGTTSVGEKMAVTTCAPPREGASMEETIDEEELRWELESAVDWGEDGLPCYRRLGAQDWGVPGLCWFEVGPVHWGGAGVPHTHKEAAGKQQAALLAGAAAAEVTCMEDAIGEEALHWELESAVDWAPSGLPHFRTLAAQDWGEEGLSWFEVGPVYWAGCGVPL